MRAIVFTVLLSLLPPSLALADHALAPGEAHEASLDGEVTIVDVRLPMEWAATGLPQGALGVPLQDPKTFEVRPDFVADLLEAVGGDRDAELALICARGNRSSFAQDLLQAAGFRNVHDVSEGVVGGPNGPGWLARHLPTQPCRVC